MERDGVHVKGGRAGALKPGKLNLEFHEKPLNEGDLSVLTSHETMHMTTTRSTHRENDAFAPPGSAG